MSRELKLALILGFASVLVVGVLISDHMSGARQAQIAELTPEDRAPAYVAPSPNAMASLPEPASSATPPETTPRDATLREPVIAGIPEDEPLAPAFEESSENRAIASADRESSRLEQFLAWSEKQGVRFEELQDRVLAVPETPAKRETPRNEQPRDNATRTPSAPPPQPATRTATYTVAEGDSLWKIAERFYGDGSKHAEIAKANPGAVGPDGQLFVGRTLTLPGATQGETRQAPAQQPRQTQAQARTYTVKKGETLGKIAARELGSAKRWPEIVALNKSVISDPDNVPAGVSLRLPPR